jgi:drug/metabolite transporter (DMT)-like permease
VTALLLALVSSASYGASDFLASRVTKRLSPVLLVLYSQAAQGLVLLVLVLAVRQPFAPVGLSWGAAAGALIAIALLGTTRPWPLARPQWWPRWPRAAPWSRYWSTWRGAHSQACLRWSGCSSSGPASC